MLTTDDRARYLRHILLREVGAQGQQAMSSARVLVVGAGGLGAPVIQYLAAAGVGRLAIADPDRVELSNLQRQTLFRTEDIGAGKAASAARFVAALNPGVAVEAIDAAIDAGNADELLAGADLVIEGVDNFATRHALNAAAIRTRTPLVSAAIGRFDGQLSVFKPWAGDLPCYRCFMPEAPPRHEVLTCAEEGVLGPLAGVVGSMAALEALKEIAGFGESLAGFMLLYDGLSQTMRRVRLPRDPACADCGALARPAD